MAKLLYICHSAGPLDQGLRECLDMLLTGAAFGQETTLWLSSVTLQALGQSRLQEEQLENLAAFGVTCVALAEHLYRLTGTLPIPVQPLAPEAIAALHRDAQQVVVF